MISLNRNVEKKLHYILDNAERLGCQYKKLSNGAHVVDMGVYQKGSFLAAKLFTEIELADLGTCEYRDYVLEDGTSVLAVEVLTSEPQLSCKYSFIAFYPLGKVGDICMIGSGPGRAVAHAPEDYCFHVPNPYKDVDAEIVVLGVQEPVLPDVKLADEVATQCNMPADKIYFLAHATTSIVASVQVAGRILEQTLHKMMMQEENSIEDTLEFAKGFALVAPVTDDDDEAMGKINDSLLYGGRSQYWVHSETDERITRILPKLVTEYSKDYGQLFKDLYLAAD